MQGSVLFSVAVQATPLPSGSAGSNAKRLLPNKKGCWEVRVVVLTQKLISSVILVSPRVREALNLHLKEKEG